MKKIMLLSLLVSVVIYAQNTEKNHSIETMQNLELGMETILKGLMYNNKNILIKGVNEIGENSKNIDAFNIKNEKDRNFKPKKYAETESKVITALAEDILTSFNKGDRRRSVDTFKKLQNQCMNCHALIRKW